MIHEVSELIKLGVFSGKVSLLTSGGIVDTVPCLLIRGQVLIVVYKNELLATSTFRRANYRNDSFLANPSSLRPINSMLGSYGLEFHPTLISSLSKRIESEEFISLH